MTSTHSAGIAPLVVLAVCLCLGTSGVGWTQERQVLARCRIVTQGPDGQPSAVVCGGVTYRTITQAQARTCAGWARDCPRWEERSLLLDRLRIEVDGLVLRAEGSETESQALRVDLAECRDLAAGRWSIWTVSALSAGGVILGFALGILVGLFSG